MVYPVHERSLISVFDRFFATISPMIRLISSPPSLHFGLLHGCIPGTFFMSWYAVWRYSFLNPVFVSVIKIEISAIWGNFLSKGVDPNESGVSGMMIIISFWAFKSSGHGDICRLLFIQVKMSGITGCASGFPELFSGFVTAFWFLWVCFTNPDYPDDSVPHCENRIVHSGNTQEQIRFAPKPWKSRPV